MAAAHSFCAPIDLPCGATAPASPHSVVVSLPTLRDVIGYETGCPQVLRSVQCGYPRFVEASPISRVQAELLRLLQPALPAPDAVLVLVSTQRFGQGMLAWVGSHAPLSSASALLPGEQLLQVLGCGSNSSSSCCSSSAPAAGTSWQGLVSTCGGSLWGASAGAGAAPAADDSSSALQWAVLVCLPGEALAPPAPCAAASALRKAACAYQQHTGCRLSSRDAELLGVRLGLWGADACVTAGEEGSAPAAQAAMAALVQAAFAGALPPLLAANGMAAITCAFMAVQRLQARAAVAAAAAAAAAAAPAPAAPAPPRLCDQWLMLGSLYLDTGCLLQRFPALPGVSPAPLLLASALDLAGLEALLRAHGHRLAGVVTECPTNPLLQSCDLPAVRALLAAHAPQAVFIVDPTLAGLGNINPLPHCDIVVCSLTKYAGASGDVMGGVVCVNAASRHAGELVASGLGSSSSSADADAAAAAVVALCSPLLPRVASAPCQPPSARDLQRLASSAHYYVPRGVQQCSAAAAAVYQGLSPRCGRAGSGLSALHWAGAGESGRNLAALACGGVDGSACAGCMLTLELEGTFPVRGSSWSHEGAAAVLERFYAALRCVKGPSFGTIYTLACPFLYLAHYDMVSCDKGRFELADRGLNPYLIRLCVGEEPADVVIKLVEDALQAIRA